MGLDWGRPEEATVFRSRSSSGEEEWAGLPGEHGSRDATDVACSTGETSDCVTSVNTTTTFLIGCR